MLPFQDAAPTPADDWRHIVRFGRNVASYKFALGRALLNLAAQQTFVRLEDLSVPFAVGISRSRGELDDAKLAEATVRLGFNNVIDALHIGRGFPATVWFRQGRIFHRTSIRRLPFAAFAYGLIIASRFCRA
jgi:hypothetical protein